MGVSLQRASPIRSLAGQGVDAIFSQMLWLERAAVSCAVANATHDKTSDGHSRSRCSRHSLHNDTSGTRTAFPHFTLRRLPPWKENLSPLAPHREQYWLVPCGFTSTVTALYAAYALSLL